MCIDHQLRPESKAEATRAASQAASLGLQPIQTALQWESVPAKGKMMEAASTARYRLLRQLCKERSVPVLLTGHHAGVRLGPCLVLVVNDGVCPVKLFAKQCITCRLPCNATRQELLLERVLPMTNVD